MVEDYQSIRTGGGDTNKVGNNSSGSSAPATVNTMSRVVIDD